MEEIGWPTMVGWEMKNSGNYEEIGEIGWPTMVGQEMRYSKNYGEIGEMD